MGMTSIDSNRLSSALKRIPEVAVLRSNTTTARMVKLAIDAAIKEDERKYWEEKKKRLINAE